MKNVLIISHFAEIKSESNNCRFMYLANMLKKRDIGVEIIISSFSHIKKRQRGHGELEKEHTDNNVTSIFEPGYKKNISIKRLYSHMIMSKNLKSYLLNKKDKPTVIYCAVPSLLVAKVAAEYAQENNVKFIIDVQDLWPEAFELVFNIPIISKLIFNPLKKIADLVYKQADSIVAVSETYKERCKRVNNTAKNNISVFLGTELKRFDRIKPSDKVCKKNNDIWIGYVGTLGHSYDLKCVIDSINILSKTNDHNIKLVVMGNGPLENKFKEYSDMMQVDANYLGRLPYEEMVSVLKKCDIAVNPIMKGAAQSIINKVGDYAAAGLPVLNTQECFEYRNLLDKYSSGYNCNCEDANDLANKMEILISDKNLRVRMGKNNRVLAEELFDRKRTYYKIIELIEGYF